MYLENIIEFAGLALGIVGGAIIVIGASIAMFRYIKIQFIREKKKFFRGKVMDQVRLNFGRHIALGLEFFIAKDVIETIFVPSWVELGQLAGLVAIRIALSFFLARELKMVEK